MADNQEWNLNKEVASPTDNTQITDNNWNVSQSSISTPSTLPQGNQQWEITAQQWDLQQTTPQQREKPQNAEDQWNASKQKPRQPEVQWGAARPEQQKTVESVSPKSWTIDQPLPQTTTGIQTDRVQQTTRKEPNTDPVVTRFVPSEPASTQIQTRQASSETQQAVCNEVVDETRKDPKTAKDTPATLHENASDVLTEVSQPQAVHLSVANQQATANEGVLSTSAVSLPKEDVVKSAIGETMAPKETIIKPNEETNFPPKSSMVLPGIVDQQTPSQFTTEQENTLSFSATKQSASQSAAVASSPQVTSIAQMEKPSTPSEERPTSPHKTVFKSVTQISAQSGEQNASERLPNVTTQQRTVVKATTFVAQTKVLKPEMKPKNAIPASDETVHRRSPQQSSVKTVAQQNPQQASVKTVAQQNPQQASVKTVAQQNPQQASVKTVLKPNLQEANVQTASTGPQPNSQQASVQSAMVTPKTFTSSEGTHESMREGGDEIALEEKQKGVIWLGPDLEGWVDKTKALKEEFRRQSDANELYFVKNVKEVDLKTLNSSEDAAKYVYNVTDLNALEVVNLIRCVLNEYHHSEAGPFFFQFGEDKKFKLELLPTATQPGNGLIKTVGRRKYYSYPDICSMLKSAGVTSKGLGIMLQKLNTSGLKSALHNDISPMNELHFMLLFEVAKRLIRGPHGFSLSTEPEIDQLPIGVAVSRMITMFCRGNYCLNYEAVFGVHDKYNPFVDNSVVLRRQKMYALNKLFYDAEVRPQARENPHIAKFLKYHNGFIIKTTKGYLDELDMSFKGF